MIILVMGVSGAGKSTVGRLLAERLHWSFIDADDLHSAANKAKMAAGHQLTDADRMPWLQLAREQIAGRLSRGEDTVVAISALKRAYRDLLTVDPSRMRLVYLRGAAELIARRLAARHGHFMNPTLLRSQLDTLEEPSSAITVDIDQPPERIVDAVLTALGKPAS